MKVSGSLPSVGNSIFNVGLEVHNPVSGFEFSIMETGAAVAVNLIQFSGVSGYLFDQSGNFFGGYQSGAPFEMCIHYDKTNTGFKYYLDNVLIANNMTSQTGPLAENANHMQFQKYSDSSLSIAVSGQPS